jgi:hypothetical protein
MKIVKATYVKANKGYSKPTSESYSDYKKWDKGFSMLKKTYSVKMPKCK